MASGAMEAADCEREVVGVAEGDATASDGAKGEVVLRARDEGAS